MDAYLKTEHLDAGYDGKAILHDVCLRVQRGRIVTQSAEAFFSTGRTCESKAGQISPAAWQS